MISEVFFELFITGFVMAWGPCVMSCSMMLPYFAGTKKGWWNGFRAAFIFSIGRLAAYIFLGGVAGFSGTLLSSLYYTSNFKYKIQIYGGIFIAVLGITIILSGIKKWKVCSFIHRWDHGSVFLAGIVTGLVPCAPLLAVLSYIVLHAKNHIIGAIGGGLFGIGTLFSPFLLLGGISAYFPNLIKNEKIYSSFQKICGAVVIYLGVKLIISGWIML